MPPRRPTVVPDPIARGATPPTRSLKERLGAIRNIPPFLALIWATSKPLTVWTVLLRLVRAVLPVVTLYVGKLIIDEVMARTAAGATPTSLTGWVETAVASVPGVAGAKVTMVFDPPWDQSRMSDEARVALDMW